jgi:hypothetical protein
LSTPGVLGLFAMMAVIFPSVSMLVAGRGYIRTQKRRYLPPLVLAFLVWFTLTALLAWESRYFLKALN